MQLYALTWLLAAISLCAGGILRAPTVTQVTEPVEHGEGPFWDSDLGLLFFVDINGHRLHQWDPVTNIVTSADVGGAVGFAIPVAGLNRFIAGKDHDIVEFSWTGASDVILQNQDVQFVNTADHGPDQGGNRFNDAKADVRGRLWAGTMGNDGSLFSLNSDTNDIVQQISGVGTSNGIAWNSDNTIMYYIDTPTNNVDALDFDLLNGVISNRRTIFSLTDAGVYGAPDGMTIDADNNLWVALWGGDAVIKVDPRTPNTLLDRVVLPANQVTSVAWGGADLATLYVTTSRAGLTAEQLTQQPLAGAVFAIEGLGVGGLRASRVVREV